MSDSKDDLSPSERYWLARLLNYDLTPRQLATGGVVAVLNRLVAKGLVKKLDGSGYEVVQ